MPNWRVTAFVNAARGSEPGSYTASATILCFCLRQHFLIALSRKACDRITMGPKASGLQKQRKARPQSCRVVPALPPTKAPTQRRLSGLPPSSRVGALYKQPKTIASRQILIGAASEDRAGKHCLFPLPRRCGKQLTLRRRRATAPDTTGANNCASKRTASTKGSVSGGHSREIVARKYLAADARRSERWIGVVISLSS